MKRGSKRLTIAVDGRTFDYDQLGWWYDLNDPNDRKGQLVDEHNQVAGVARRTAGAVG
jgi:hypothetical protein